MQASKGISKDNKRKSCFEILRKNMRLQEAKILLHDAEVEARRTAIAKQKAINAIIVNSKPLPKSYQERQTDYCARVAASLVAARVAKAAERTAARARVRYERLVKNEKY
jgi:hypothetical protein